MSLHGEADVNVNEPVAERADSASEQALNQNTISGGDTSDEFCAQVSEELSKIIGTCDLSTMTLGKVRASLVQTLGVEPGILGSKKELIERLVRKHLKARLEDEARKKGERRKSRGEKRQSQELPEQSPKKLSTPRSRTIMQPKPEDLPAKALDVRIAGTPVELKERDFASGRRSFLACQTIPMTSGGTTFEVQCLVQCVVTGVVSTEAAAPEDSSVGAATPSPVRASAQEDTSSAQVETSRALVSRPSDID